MKGKSHLQSNRKNVYLVGMIKSNIKYSSTPPFHPFLFLYSVSNTDRKGITLPLPNGSRSIPNLIKVSQEARTESKS